MKRPSRRFLPICTTRPSWTATTDAFGALVRSTIWSFGAGCPWAAAAAAAAGETAEPAPGADFAAGVLGAVAWAVALDAEGASSVRAALHSSEEPSTGGRPSTRPVSVAITAFGYVEISFARSITESTYSSEWL